MRPGTVLVAHPSPDLYGSDRMVLESVDGLLAAGWRVVVTVPRPGPLLAELAARDVEVAVVAVPVLRKALLSPRGLAGFAAGTLRALPGMLRLLRRTRPDVVYVNTVTVPLWLAAARLTGRPVLGHVHEAEEGVPRPVRAALALPLLLAGAVVVNSRASAGALEVVPRLSRRVRVLYNGVPGPARVPPLRADPYPARLVLVGRLSPRKGTDVAVAAVAALRAAGRDVTLDVAGSVFPGYEWYERELAEQVRRLGLGDAVRFLGFVPSVWDAYAAADVALVPSRVEPFGNTAVEGQLAGRPVVVSGTQGLVEIVRPERTGLVVPPGDPEALAAAVGRLLDDWPWARGLAEAGRQDVRERFAPDRYRTEIAGAVAALAGLAGPAHPAFDRRFGGRGPVRAPLEAVRETAEEDAALAAELAGRAGALLRDLRAAGGDGAAGDAAADRFLLAELARARPGDAVLSEERADDPSRLRRDRVWIVDPLDGTREFGEPGRTDWAVHVALWAGGGLAAGAVALPALGEVWRTDHPGHPGQPGQPCQPGGGSGGGEVRRVAVSRTRAPAWAAPVAADLGAELVPMGSAGAKVAAVLRGEVDAYLHDGGQYEWDSAAPVAVARAAGLHAARVDGGELEYNRPDPWSPDLMVCAPAAAGRLVDLVTRHRKGAAP